MGPCFMTSLEAQQVCSLATWEISPLAVLLGETLPCSSSEKGGKNREFICLGLSKFLLVKCYPRGLTPPGFCVTSGYLRCQIPCPVVGHSIQVWKW